MAIKKQTKRSLEDAAPVPAENGSPSKKQKIQSKKVKPEKAPQVQDDGAPEAKAQKIKKPKPAGEAVKQPKPAAEAVKQPKVKQEDGAPLSEAVLAKIAAKKAKNAEKRAKRLENRKEARKEGGQYKPEKTMMTVEQIQLRIDAILSRPELTKTAKRKLGVLKKRMQIAKGTYVEKPKPESTGPKLTPSQKRHGRKIRSKARKLEDNLKEKIIVSDKITSESDAAATTPVKQESAVPVKPVAAKGKPAKPGKQQQQQKGKGKGAKQPVVKKEEPEESEEDEDDDEEAEDEEDSNEEVDTTVNDEDEDEDDDEDDDEEEDDEEDEEEEEEDDDDEAEAEEKEVASPVKKAKQEPMKKKAEEKKPLVKKENAKGNFKNGPAANGDSQDGKKKRFVLFVGNLPYDANPEEIKKHFLTKVGDVANVRIPTKPGTSTPRGFAYVEVTNETDYEKGLSLHNTNLKGRRINVEYTRGGSKSAGNKSDVVAKNKKLHAMRKQGMLAGSRKEGHSRNDRRQKARQSPA